MKLLNKLKLRIGKPIKPFVCVHLMLLHRIKANRRERLMLFRSEKMVKVGRLFRKTIIIFQLKTLSASSVLSGLLNNFLWNYYPITKQNMCCSTRALKKSTSSLIVYNSNLSLLKTCQYLIITKRDTFENFWQISCDTFTVHGRWTASKFASRIFQSWLG